MGLTEIGGDVRFWTVTDTATAMRVMVVVPAMVRSEEGRRHLWGAGYNITDRPPSIAIVTRLADSTTSHDPFAWTDWSMRAFHMMLLDEFDDVWHIPDGGEVDVYAYRIALLAKYGPSIP